MSHFYTQLSSLLLACLLVSSSAFSMDLRSNTQTTRGEPRYLHINLARFNIDKVVPGLQVTLSGTDQTFYVPATTDRDHERFSHNYNATVGPFYPADDSSQMASFRIDAFSPDRQLIGETTFEQEWFSPSHDQSKWIQLHDPGTSHIPLDTSMGIIEVHLSSDETNAPNRPVFPAKTKKITRISAQRDASDTGMKPQAIGPWMYSDGYIEPQNIGEDEILSYDTKNRVHFQTDRNVVFQHLFGSTWSVVYHTNSWGTSANKFVMQEDGNLVLYAGTIALWWSSTNQNPFPNPEYNFFAFDNGNFAVVVGTNTSDIKWQTNTLR